MSEKTIIEAGPDSFGKYLQKVWKYRALIFTFAKRDLKVKYAQTFIGIGWTILQPATALVLFTFFFGYLLHWKTGDIPFALYVFSGLLGWNFFSYTVLQGTNTIMESAQIIRKTYFPKFILPLSKILVGLVEMCISLVLLMGLMAWYGQIPSWRIIFLPMVVIFNALCTITLVTWIGALSYRIRDLLHAVPFLMYFGIWVTPVFFTYGILPDHLQFLWSINPMTGITELWRYCLFPEWELHIEYLVSMCFLVPLFIAGFWLYSRNESSFSDFA